MLRVRGERLKQELREKLRIMKAANRKGEREEASEY